jgi:hypothetical protein
MSIEITEEVPTQRAVAVDAAIERAAFEKHYRKTYGLARMSNLSDKYAAIAVETAWQAWLTRAAVAPLMQAKVAVAWLRDDGAQAGSETSVITNAIRDLWLQCNSKLVERYTIPLYRAAIDAAPEVQS